MRSRVRIASVGPASCVQGGVSRVIRLIEDHLPERFRVRHISTFDRYTGYEGAQPSEKGSRLGQALIFFMAVLQVLVRALARNTVFHLHFAGRGSLLRKGILCIILRSLRCQYVVHSHAADTDLFQEWLPGFVRRSVLWGLTGAAYVIVLTKFWRHYFADFLGLPEDRILLLPNPADLPAAIPDRSGRAKVSLLFLGRIGVRKGAFDVIRALAGLPRAVRANCRLVMAGDGEIEEARALATELGCQSQVSFLGWVETDAVKCLLREADVLLLPSRAEGMAMALLEAMSWGLPAITTGVCGADEFLEDGTNCLLVAPGDIQGIRNAMKDLACNPAFRRQLGGAARETMSRFSIDNYILKLADIYDELANNPSARGAEQMEFPMPDIAVPVAAVSHAGDPVHSGQS